jgi:hypothetical protein
MLIPTHSGALVLKLHITFMRKLCEQQWVNLLYNIMRKELLQQL